MESFSLKCRNEEQLNQWQSTLEKLLADILNRHKDESTTPIVKRTQVSNTQLASLQNLELPVYSRRDDDAASFIDEDDEEDYEDEEDDWENNKPKSQSLPYGQYPISGYNGRTRPRTEDGTAPPPYNWNSNSDPLPPSVPNVPPQHRHANVSMPPLPRNGMTTAPPTMATFPSNVMHHQGDNTGYFPILLHHLIQVLQLNLFVVALAQYRIHGKDEVSKSLLLL